MTTFNLPDLGEGLAEAEIVRWHVKAGDTVKVDQPMVAVETAKAVVEVPSPYTGRITELHGNPGDVVATGAPLVEFELQGRHGARGSRRAKRQLPRRRPIRARRMIRAPSSAACRRATTSSSRPPSPAATSPSPRERVRAAPAVRALAKRLGVDLASVRGTGRGGLITVDDVMTTSGPTSMHAAATVTALKSHRRRARGARPPLRRAASPRSCAACAARCIRA